MKRFIRFLKKAAKIFLVFLLTILVVYCGLNYYWGKQVESRLAAIKAAGQPVSIADLQGHPVAVDENAAPIYEQAFGLLPSSTNDRDFEPIYSILGGTPTSADWTNANKSVAHFGNILILINKAQSKPACQFDFQIDEIKKISRLQGFRDIMRLLCACMILKAHEGNTQEFASYANSALKLTDDLGRDYSLIDYMIRDSMISNILSSLNRAFQYCQLSESQIRQLDTALSKINSTVIYKQNLEGERVYFLHRNSQIRKAGGNLPLCNGDTLAYLDITAKYIENAHMSYSIALSNGLIKGDSDDNLPFYAVLTKIIVPVFNKTNVIHYKSEAEISCARVFLAIQSYKIKHSHYPKNLNELKPGIEPRFLIDSFSGKNLVYKLLGKGYILYSVGPNQKDDGGMKSHLNGNTREYDDIAWEIDH